MQAWIDPDKCEGHTLCGKVAPQLFKFNKEDGRSYATVAEVSPEQAALARKAVAACPERAIVIRESS